MSSIDSNQVTIVGAGLMGMAIATLCAAHGFKVVVCDANQSMLASFAERARPVVDHFTRTAPQAAGLMDRIRLGSDLGDCVAGSFLVQEAIHEDMGAKQALFRALDGLCPPEVILATNTSSLMLTEMAEGVATKGRFVGIHYVSPAHLVRAVEIITTDTTDPATVEAAKRFLLAVDRIGIVCREQPGFLINRIQYALKAELMRIVDEGAASVEDIDTAVRLSIGPRLALWGPMLQEDLSTSKITVLAVSDYLAEATGQPHFRGSPILREMVSKGETGAAAGAGWYLWTKNHGDVVAERDRQLADLLDWLREGDRLAALGMVPRET